MIRVMIVDDQRPARMGFALMVAKDRELQVVGQVENGQTALDMLASLSAANEPLPDVILMDVRMPVMDGIDATAAIKQRCPNIKILMLTTYDQDDYAFGALGAGASGFLLKDVHTADLCRAIHSVYEGDAILTPRITGEVIKRGIPKANVKAEQAELRARFMTLGKRELEVASLVSEGLSNAEIAERLSIQPDSVKKTVSRILAKLDARERVNIAVLWYKSGMDELQ
ncbi:response regulator transcription factor [Bifidobacterium sp. ESL0745]|uniref:response regulator transcription factor n=1 Tax=Bifidobacterium sp. ESL0745 TaxID=2983226 RepID=UPI0023F84390|nr:response regulator transcription factor [Bifidobacterium sp. ESL0745]MDF7665287.1 response regulator transcription factor [Bifidobacterium sp. ESL0745]